MNRAILNKISQYFHSQPIEKAWIFGSYARSEEDAKSDIDILVSKKALIDVDIICWSDFYFNIEISGKTYIELINRKYWIDLNHHGLIFWNELDKFEDWNSLYHDIGSYATMTIYLTIL